MRHDLYDPQHLFNKDVLKKDEVLEGHQGPAGRNHGGKKIKNYFFKRTRLSLCQSKMKMKYDGFDDSTLVAGVSRSSREAGQRQFVESCSLKVRDERRKPLWRQRVCCIC